MRDDLRGALDAVRWAEAHIPALQQRFEFWQRRDPYEIVVEPDPDDAKWEFLAAYLRTPIDSLITGDVGAIINAARTALDILMFSVLSRHRVKPRGNTHFPIFTASSDFLSRVNMLETKKRITAAEATAIKSTKAYRGGDAFLYPIHHLDIMRKHMRLLIVQPLLEKARLTVLGAASFSYYRVMQDKTIFYRLPARSFRPTKGNTFLTAEIFFDEPTLLATKQPAIGVLRNFTNRARALIEDFP